MIEKSFRTAIVPSLVFLLSAAANFACHSRSAEPGQELAVIEAVETESDLFGTLELRREMGLRVHRFKVSMPINHRYTIWLETWKHRAPVCESFVGGSLTLGRGVAPDDYITVSIWRDMMGYDKWGLKLTGGGSSWGRMWSDDPFRNIGSMGWFGKGFKWTIHPGETWTLPLQQSTNLSPETKETPPPPDIPKEAMDDDCVLLLRVRFEPIPEAELRDYSSGTGFSCWEMYHVSPNQGKKNF